MIKREWPLLEAREIFGLVTYESRWGKKVSNQDADQQYRFVYSFKKYGTGKETIQQLVEKAAELFACQQIICVPGSKPESNQLQLLLGTKIKRLVEVEKTKYRQGKYEFDDASVSVAPVTGKVLLVDDVATTGQTMDYFEQRLLDAGASEVVKFALGVNVKLSPLDTDFELQLEDAEEEEENDCPKLPPPLASPIFVTDLERYELLQRYDIRSLVPMSAFEMQLLMVIAGLEKRIRELDPLPD